jgi:hypothetical protein
MGKVRRIRGLRQAVGAVAMLSFVVSAAAGSNTTATPNDTGAITLRLGYFPNLTHAPAIIGLDKGLLAQELGPNVRHLLRRCGHLLHWVEPGDQRVREVQGPGHWHHLWVDLGRRCAGREARYHHGPATAGQDAGYSSTRKHARRRAPRLAQEPGADGDEGRRRRRPAQTAGECTVARH